MFKYKNIFRFSFLVIAFVFIAAVALAQNERLNYQGVARNADGSPKANQAITVNLSIGSSFSELHSVTTNSFGLFTIAVGSINTTAFAAINWSTPQSLRVEINSVSMGPPSPLNYVPYALYANQLKGFSFSNTAPSSGQVLKWNGTAWAPGIDNGSVAVTVPITSSLVSGVTTLSIPKADVNTDGYLSKVDWDTFNKKVAANTLIIAGTNTKITYDAKGLVTGGTQATATDISNTSSGNISSTTVQTAINELDAEKLPANAAITGGTNTKITYDAKGLVTGGTQATTADILESTNKKYVTDAEKTLLSNTSNSNSGDLSLAAGSQNYLAISGQTLTANAVDLSGGNASGTLAAARFPALSGDVTTTAGSVATTISNGSVTATKLNAGVGLTSRFAVADNLGGVAYRILSGSDLPTGSGNYIANNSTLTSQSASFNINGNGSLGGTLDIAGKTTITDNTGSMNSTTGALVISGGVGIGGDLNVGGVANFNRNLRKENANYTITTSDYYVIFTGTNNSIFTLPTAVGKEGKEYLVKNLSSLGANLTVKTSSTESIIDAGGSNTNVTVGPGANNNSWVKLVSDGTGWIAFKLF